MNYVKSPFGVEINARLLKPGSVPPDFGFGNENAFYMLRQLQGIRRILLAFCPAGIGEDCKAGMRSVRDDWPEFRMRNLAVIVISPEREEELLSFGKTEALPVILISDEMGETITAYGARGLSMPVIYLIGKDGTVQAVWANWPTNRELFRVIDASAERQQELGQRSEAA